MAGELYQRNYVGATHPTDEVVLLNPDGSPLQVQIKSPENLLVSGLGFLSVPSQAVAGSQVAHVAAAVA